MAISSHFHFALCSACRVSVCVWGGWGTNAGRTCYYIHNSNASGKSTHACVASLLPAPLIIIIIIGGGGRDGSDGSRRNLNRRY